MDIQKELESFKTVAIGKGWSVDGETTQTNYRFYSLTTNSGWEMWQAAKAQAAPEWILVEDKLPTENGNYLVCIDGDVFYLTAKWVKNHFKFLARGYGLTEDFTDWRYCEGVKVTHWMTLPAAPKEPAND